MYVGEGGGGVDERKRMIKKTNKPFLKKKKGSDLVDTEMTVKEENDKKKIKDKKKSKGFGGYRNDSLIPCWR